MPASLTTDRPVRFSAPEFRAALGQFATGVTIVTTRAPDGQTVGLTVSSFNSVSLEPPLVLWSLGLSSGTLAVFQACSHYAINVLTTGQLALAQRFAMRNIDRWAGVTYTEGIAGAPLITGSAATFECRNDTQHRAGDHLIFIGEVLHCTHQPDSNPLIYHGGRFYAEHPLDSPSPRAP